MILLAFLSAYPQLSKLCGLFIPRNKQSPVAPPLVAWEHSDQAGGWHLGTEPRVSGGTFPFPTCPACMWSSQEGQMCLFQPIQMKPIRHPASGPSCNLIIPHHYWGQCPFFGWGLGEVRSEQCWLVRKLFGRHPVWRLENVSLQASLGYKGARQSGDWERLSAGNFPQNMTFFPATGQQDGPSGSEGLLGTAG